MIPGRSVSGRGLLGSSEVLTSDDPEQLELPDGVGAGARGEHGQALVLPGGGEHFAVEVDDTEGGVHDAFAVAAAYGDVVALPQRGELGAGGVQGLDKLAGQRVVRAQGDSGPQNTALVLVVLRRIEVPGVGVGEPPVGEAARESREDGATAI